METKMEKAEHNEQQGIPTLRIVLAAVAHMRRFMLSEIGCHALYGHCFRERFGAGSGEGYRGISQGDLWLGAPYLRVTLIGLIAAHIKNVSTHLLMIIETSAATICV